jgi:hypothetical protein
MGPLWLISFWFMHRSNLKIKQSITHHAKALFEFILVFKSCVELFGEQFLKTIFKWQFLKIVGCVDTSFYKMGDNQYYYP